jgi:hypothetical protein
VTTLSSIRDRGFATEEEVTALAVAYGGGVDLQRAEVLVRAILAAVGIHVRRGPPPAPALN